MIDKHGIEECIPLVLNGEPVVHPDTLTSIDHPPHYGGADDPYEVIKVIEAWDLDFHLGNVLKYIGRAGKKDPAKLKEDLEKARWYLERKLSKL